jgi:hypothetical protein
MGRGVSREGAPAVSTQNTGAITGTNISVPTGDVNSSHIENSEEN